MYKELFISLSPFYEPPIMNFRNIYNYYNIMFTYIKYY